MIPDIITGKIMLIACLAAFLAGLAGGGYVVHLYYAPRLEAAELKVETLGEDIRRQNQAVDKLRTDGEVRAKAAAAALAGARKEADQAYSDAAALQGTELKPGEDACAAAGALISKELTQ